MEDGIAAHPYLVRLLSLAGMLLVVAVVAVMMDHRQVCAGPADMLPYVDLRFAPWLQQHPGSDVRACVDTRCKTIPAGSQGETSLYVPTRATPESTLHTLTVTATRHGRQILSARAQVRVTRHVGDGACGGTVWWSMPSATLTAAGHLEVGRTGHR